MNSFIYLHGFASSPNSDKARAFHDRFAEIQIPLMIPDLNQNDFSRLTLTRQIEQVAKLFQDAPQPVTLIGSSLGGLTAAWLAEQYSEVERVVLLAPAFEFLSNWLPRLGPEQVKQWQVTGTMSIFHYGENKMLPLHYSFLEDVATYDESQLKRPVPTLLLHGVQDPIVPIQVSINYAKQRPWVVLGELESDHALGNVVPQMWQAIRSFCQI